MVIIGGEGKKIAPKKIKKGSRGKNLEISSHTLGGEKDLKRGGAEKGKKQRVNGAFGNQRTPRPGKTHPNPKPQ